MMFATWAMMLATLLATPLACGAQCGARVLNDDAHFPEGPVWYRFTASGHLEPAIDGNVFYIAADATITQVAIDLHNANGLAVSADGMTRYVVETEEHRLLQFSIAADGTPSDRRVFPTWRSARTRKPFTSWRSTRSTGHPTSASSIPFPTTDGSERLVSIR
jgi:hypothetical protein